MRSRWKNSAYIIIIMVIISLAGCGQENEKTEIHVLTAASMTPAMNELKELYESENPYITIVPVYGGSGQLKDQISQGAPADVFLSAALRWMEELNEAEVVSEFENLLINELVAVSHMQNDFKMEGLDGLLNDSVDTVGIGDPATVPAGEYAKQAIEAAGIWEEVEDKLVFASDVRQVLTYVETGNVDVGVVYETDVYELENIRIDYTLNNHEPIIYPVGFLANSNHPEEVREFYEWLKTTEALNVFESYGFGVY
ncbi:molybdate ABC transporter substrate-binding protein [Salipaludibacillus sp. CUR1]|uniref:molybdate ABC transporter substrate-binding protein n=1 Tax=Salipaludibacillus sp. CUR1 TaxID=2820003 RepID=UPI001E385014|nr:molybdate ABC transporter substrate-binding protein [Salipaludibacillus sp. CUR1]MCE7794030.1 molybdate ABC transporter substrate-binding protein [Salipaludibacillus sp. CUR1]